MKRGQAQNRAAQGVLHAALLGLPDGTAEGVLLPPPAAHIVYTHMEPLALSGGLPCSLAERR